MIHQGITAGNRIIARLVEAIVAPAGVSFSHSTDAIRLGIGRDSSSVKWGFVTTNNVEGGENSHYVRISIEIKTRATKTNPVIANGLLLAVGFVRLRLKYYTANGTAIYLNFVENTGTPSVPVGSQILDYNIKRDNDQKDRTTTHTFSVDMTIPEWDYLWANIAAAPGTSAGSTLGLQAQTNTYNDFMCAGVDSLAVTNADGTALYGILMEDCKETVETTTDQQADNRNRKTAEFLRYELKGSGLQHAPNDVRSIITDQNANLTLLITEMAGDTVQGTSGALTLSVNDGDGMIAEDKTQIGFSIKGKTPLIPTVGYDVTTVTTKIEMKKVGYA